MSDERHGKATAVQLPVKWEADGWGSVAPGGKRVYLAPHHAADPRPSLEIHDGHRAIVLPPEAMLATAALALHGQPFGFHVGRRGHASGCHARHADRDRPRWRIRWSRGPRRPHRHPAPPAHTMTDEPLMFERVGDDWLKLDTSGGAYHVIRHDGLWTAYFKSHGERMGDPLNAPGDQKTAIRAVVDHNARRVGRTPAHDRSSPVSPTRERGSAASRGYNARWRKARATHLAKHPLCVRCEKEGRVTAATVVDHIVPHCGDSKLFWDTSNWQSLCKPHHDGAKQSEEKTGRVRGCDPAGVPLDPTHRWNTG